MAAISRPALSCSFNKSPTTEDCKVNNNMQSKYSVFNTYKKILESSKMIYIKLIKKLKYSKSPTYKPSSY